MVAVVGDLGAGHATKGSGSHCKGSNPRWNPAAERIGLGG